MDKYGQVVNVPERNVGIAYLSSSSNIEVQASLKRLIEKGESFLFLKFMAKLFSRSHFVAIIFYEENLNGQEDDMQKYVLYIRTNMMS